MDEGTLYGRGISFPPRLDADGRLAWSAGPENVRQSIQALLLTEKEERLMLPEFGAGLNSFLFQPNIVSTHRLIEERVRQALARWEPRVRLERVSVERDPADDERAIVTIEYRLVATGARERLQLGLQLTA